MNFWFSEDHLMLSSINSVQFETICCYWLVETFEISDISCIISFSMLNILMFVYWTSLNDPSTRSIIINDIVHWISCVQRCQSGWQWSKYFQWAEQVSLSRDCGVLGQCQQWVELSKHQVWLSLITGITCVQPTHINDSNLRYNQMLCPTSHLHSLISDAGISLWVLVDNI